MFEFEVRIIDVEDDVEVEGKSQDEQTYRFITAEVEIQTPGIGPVVFKVGSVTDLDDDEFKARLESALRERLRTSESVATLGKVLKSSTKHLN